MLNATGVVARNLTGLERRRGGSKGPPRRISNSLPGGHSEREPPDPIPNSEVKTLCADGSVPFRHARVGHCQASNRNPRARKGSGVFCWSHIYIGHHRIPRPACPHPSSNVTVQRSGHPALTAALLPGRKSGPAQRQVRYQCNEHHKAAEFVKRNCPGSRRPVKIMKDRIPWPSRRTIGKAITAAAP